MQFSKKHVLLWIFVAITLCSISLYAADHSEYTLRAETSEVRLAFAAADRSGHVVKSLRPEDIAVADNGSIIRHFRSFRTAAESPLELVILLDASDSLESQIPAEIADVRSFIADAAWGERDRVSILAFGGMHPMLLCARNCRTEAAQSMLSSLRAKGATPLYDALVQAAEILEKDRDTESRPAMILFSDGLDTSSSHGLQDALQAAQNLQAAIYAVNARARKSGPSEGDDVLNQLAASTGGLSYAPGQNVKEVLRGVLEDLHSGYVLTYELPQQLNGQHSVRILPTSDPKLQFRSRLAYSDVE